MKAQVLIKPVINLAITMIIYFHISLWATPVSPDGQVMAPSSPKPPIKIYSSLEEIINNSSQPAILVFFSSVCHVCWDELLEMKEFIEKFSLPVILIGISAEEKDELLAFASKYSFNYPIIQDRNRNLFRQFKVKLEPFWVILQNHQVAYIDDYLLDFQTRMDRAKQCLLRLASKLTFF